MAQMVLGNKINGEKMFKNSYAFNRVSLGHQGSLHFPTGEVFVMQNSIFRVTTFSAKIKSAIGSFFIKPCTPLNNLLYAKRAFIDDDINNFFITKSVSGIQRIFLMFVCGINFRIPHCCDAALCISGITLTFNCFSENTYGQFGIIFCDFDCRGKTAYAGTNN